MIKVVLFVILFVVLTVPQSFTQNNQERER